MSHYDSTWPSYDPVPHICTLFCIIVLKIQLFWWVAPFLMGLTLYLTLWGLLGFESSFSLKAKRDGMGMSWEESAVACWKTTTGDAITGSSGKRGLTHSSRGRIAASFAKKTKQNWWDLCPSFIRIHPYLPFQFLGFHSFLISNFTLAADILWDWEFNFCCNSATYRMIFWGWFLRNFDPAVAADKDFFQGT